MFRLKIKGDPSVAIQLVSGISGVEGEIYLTVSDLQAMLKIVGEAVAKGLAVEILPTTPTEGTGTLTAPVKALTSNSHPGASQSQPDTKEPNSPSTDESLEGLDILRKYRKKKQASEVKKPEKPESAKEKVEEASKPKAEPIKAEAPSEAPKVKVESSGPHPAKQIMEAEQELSFDEWLKLKEEAFSRKLVE
jgi:hypothetical protein